jgi:hypothetical protein
MGVTVTVRRASRIQGSEVPAVFSDRVIDKMFLRVGLPSETDRLRLGAGIRIAVMRYIETANEPTFNEVRAEIEALHRAISKHQYENASIAWAALSKAAKKLLADRAAWLHSNKKAICSSPGSSWALPAPFWTLPTPEQFLSPAHQETACSTVHYLCLISERREWRTSQSGGLTSEVRRLFLAPTPSKAEPRRHAERQLLIWLRVAFAEATGQMPPRTARHDRAGPFARMVGECLRLARAPSTDLDDDREGLAVQLINDLDRKRRLDELIGKLRRILGPLRREDAAITQIARLIEQGEAIVRRIPRGAEDGAIPDQPSLIEFEEGGRLCFYLSPMEWRTLSIKPFPRASIMKVAEALLTAVSKKKIGSKGAPEDGVLVPYG